MRTPRRQRHARAERGSDWRTSSPSLPGLRRTNASIGTFADGAGRSPAPLKPPQNVDFNRSRLGVPAAFPVIAPVVAVLMIQIDTVVERAAPNAALFTAT